MKNKQTAVEWLITKLSMELIGEIPLHRWDEIREAVQQAKQMEKEQIMKAIDRGFDEGCKFPEDISLKNAEQYYNETYKP